MQDMNDWQRVGLSGPTANLIDIKRAYASAVRITRPDDDPEAYQALRAAYDRLIRQARQRAVDEPEPDRSPLAPATTQGLPADAPEPAQGPSPQALCEHVVRTFREQGASGVNAALPQTMRDLEALPLGARLEAWVRFADMAIALEGLPDAALIAWRDHFDWAAGRDFRLERMLGTERLDALARVMRNIVEPVDDPAVLGQFDLVVAAARVIRQRSWPVALLFAALLGRPLRHQWQWLEALIQSPQLRPKSAIGRELLAGLNIAPVEKRRIGDALREGTHLNMALFFGTVICLSVALGTAYGDAAMVSFLGLLLTGLGMLLTDELLERARSLRAGLEERIGNFRRFARPPGPRWTFLWGGGLMALSAAGLWLTPGFGDAPLWTFAAVLGALFGGALAAPDTRDDGLAAVCLMTYMQLVLGGTSAELGVLLIALLFTGMRAWSLGAWHRWLSQLRLASTAPVRALAALACVAATAMPVGVAWLSARFERSVLLASTLMASVLQVQGHAAELPAAWRLLLLPVSLAAIVGSRAAFELIGRRLFMPVRS